MTQVLHFVSRLLCCSHRGHLQGSLLSGITAQEVLCSQYPTDQLLIQEGQNPGVGGGGIVALESQTNNSVVLSAQPLRAALTS